MIKNNKFENNKKFENMLNRYAQSVTERMKNILKNYDAYLILFLNEKIQVETFFITTWKIS